MFENIPLIGLTASVIAVVGLHMVIARKGPFWLGALVPSLWIVAVVTLISLGKVAPGRPYIVAIAGLVVLLWLWASGRTAQKKSEQTVPAGVLNRKS